MLDDFNKIPPCEVCGRMVFNNIDCDYETWRNNAAIFVCDYESWPDAELGYRVAWAKADGVHYFCQEHKREPVEYKLDEPPKVVDLR